MNRPYPIIVIDRSEYGPWFVFKMEEGLKAMVDFQHIPIDKNPYSNIARFRKYFPGYHINENAKRNGGSNLDYIRFARDIEQDLVWLQRVKAGAVTPTLTRS